MNELLYTNLWELFEIIVNFYQAMITMYFAYAYLGTRKSKSSIIANTTTYVILLGSSISVLNHFFLFEHFYSTIYIIIVLIYAFTNLYGTLWDKFFASIFPMIIVTISSVLTGNIISMLFDLSLYVILSENGIERFIAMLVTQFLIFYFILISLKLFKRNKKQNIELNKFEWIFIFAILLLSVVILILLNAISIEEISYEVMIYLVVIIVCLVIINILVCFIIAALDKKNEILLQNEILKFEQEYVKTYVENANEQYEIISKLRHDFIDNYGVIHTLIKEKNIESAVKHIESNLNYIGESDKIIKTNNNVVNAVVNTKFSKAQAMGIVVKSLLSSQFDYVEDIDLSRLLSNMLENSITACENITDTNAIKEIFLKITEDDCQYLFLLSNSIDSSVLKNNQELNTTKADSKNHGYGVKIIKDIANKYNGDCDFYEEENVFYCYVTLYKNKC